jgi:hypothetical protein
LITSDYINKGAGMNKQKLLKPVNSLLAIDFILLVGTAFSDDIIPRDIFEIVHPVLGYTLIACVVFHIFLNWTWVKNNISGINKK